MSKRIPYAKRPKWARALSAHQWRDFQDNLPSDVKPTLKELKGCIEHGLHDSCNRIAKAIGLSPNDYERERRRHAQLMDIAAGYGD